MTVDEVMDAMVANRGLTHPQDIAWLREDVEEAIQLREKPAPNANVVTT